MNIFNLQNAIVIASTGMTEELRRKISALIIAETGAPVLVYDMTILKMELAAADVPGVVKLQEGGT